MPPTEPKLSVNEAKDRLRLADSYSRLPELLSLADRMDRGEWLQLLGYHWSCCDNIGLHRRHLRALLPRTGPVLELMTASEIDTYWKLPDPLTIYRGCGPANMCGLSWSWDRKKAQGFPFLNRYRQAQPLLVTATVRKARILAVKLCREESEVITFEARRIAVERLTDAAGHDP